MKTNIFKLILGFFLVMVTSCNDTYLNPSAASQDQVVKDVNALISLANGLQYKFSVGTISPEYAMPSASGLLSKELIVLNAGNTNELLLSQGGGSVQANNSILTNLWNQSHLIKSNANIVLSNLNIVSDQGTKGALQAYASIFRALALGNLATFWQQAPLDVQKNAPFVDRIVILNEAISTLEAAASELAKAPVPASFSGLVPTGISFSNTINALIARYALMVGNYDKALSAANAVVLTARSTLQHDDIAPNALFFSSFSAINNTEPFDTKFSLPLALQTDVADKRIAFFYNTIPVLPGSTRNNLARASFFTANNASVPIYRPGEIMLIKAEAYVRKTPQDLTAAVAELNNVLTKTTDALGIGAGLPAYSGANIPTAILDEIYKQRCIELYLSGLRLEDSRRFGRPLTERGNRNFMPYPNSERDNNTNTPADPPN
jgi:hypothetical protein